MTFEIPPKALEAMSGEPTDVHVWMTEEDQIVVHRSDEHRLREAFDRFHNENPNVYEILVGLAREWRIARPSARCGIGMLFERARWELAVRTRGEPLRLNNNYRAFYARLMMDTEADLAELFETRRQRG